MKVWLHLFITVSLLNFCASFVREKICSPSLRNKFSHQFGPPIKKSRQLPSERSFVLAFGDPELPSLFGVNPIEFLLLSGALYKVFGPERLYAFAREAGFLFSTYGPVGEALKCISVFQIQNRFP